MKEDLDRRPWVLKTINQGANDMADRFDLASRVYSGWERKLSEVDVSTSGAPLTLGFLRGSLRCTVFGTRKFVEAEGLIFKIASVLTGGRVRNTFEA